MLKKVVKKIKNKDRALDEINSLEQNQQETRQKKIYELPIEIIDDFPNHPYKVRNDEDMHELVESIRQRGVLTPALVRPTGVNRFEMISGHRRKRACELLGMTTMRCEIVEVTREEATVLMVESNFQRSSILPSEKAFAYKMRLDAMKRQGQRTDLTSRPVGDKLEERRSGEIIGESVGESERQIQRYIRLTNLVPELLDFVDEGKIKLRPAVELSYLDEETQRDVVDQIDETDAFPSHDQAIRIRKAYEAGKIDYLKVQTIMAEEKPNQRLKYRFSFDRLRPLIPQGCTDEKAEDYVIQALTYYRKYLQRQREQER